MILDGAAPYVVVAVGFVVSLHACVSDSIASRGIQTTHTYQSAFVRIPSPVPGRMCRMLVDAETTTFLKDFGTCHSTANMSEELHACWRPLLPETDWLVVQSRSCALFIVTLLW
jgi:hypothetical protein